MSYTITSLGPRDHVIHINGKYAGAVSLFTDGTARGKPHEVYWLASCDNFDVYHLYLDDAVQALVRRHYRDLTHAGLATHEQTVAAYSAPSNPSHAKDTTP
jgi:hypothetical protein